MSLRPDMPCGRCDVGIYSYDASLTPLAHELAALPSESRRPPKCKSADRDCVGACDFIAALNADQDGWQEIKREAEGPSNPTKQGEHA